MSRLKSSQSPVAIVMAAGKGTRMKSEDPKVLFQVRGRPMIDYVLDALAQGGVRRVIVVVGHRAERVRDALAGREGIEFCLQQEQLGTGHAVMVCCDKIRDHRGPLVVVAGDAPMMQATSIASLLNEYYRKPAACLLGTVHKDDPTGLGRIVRDQDGEFLAIVEQKDASPEQQQITEVNMSYYVFDCQELLQALGKIRRNNAQREYYITDCPGVMKSEGKPVRAMNVLQPCEVLGVNTLEELQIVEAAMTATQA